MSYNPQNFKYRRPNLAYSSGSVISVETGLDGTSGDAVILFPDGQLRTETSSSRYNCTISQNAVFTNATLGSNQGGLRSGSVSSNTWYSLYAVKVTTFAANWVLVADTVVPTQANYSTLNSNFGTNGWVYLGVLPYGDNAGATSAIVKFFMSNGKTVLQNALGGTTSRTIPGVRLAHAASAVNSITYTYASGTNLGSNQIPSHLAIGTYVHTSEGGNGSANNSAVTIIYDSTAASGLIYLRVTDVPLSDGLNVFLGVTAAADISCASWLDPVLNNPNSLL